MGFIDIVANLLGTAAGMLVVYKAVVDLGLRKQARRQEDYRFLQEYIYMIEESCVKAGQPLQNLLVEQGYLAFSGEQLSAGEIRFLIKLDYPSQALKSYAWGRQFLEISYGENPEINYRGKYQSERTRKRYRKIRLGAYGCFAFLAFSSILFAKALLPSTGLHAFITGIFFVLAFGALAFLFLFDYARMVVAESLMEGEFGQVGANQSLQRTR